MAAYTRAGLPADSALREALAVELETVDFGALAAGLVGVPGGEVEGGYGVVLGVAGGLLLIDHVAILEEALEEILGVALEDEYFFYFLGVEDFIRS